MWLYGFLFSFKIETICNALTQTRLQNSCKNFVVHPKCMLDVSTKFHAFHLSPIPTPPPGNLRLRFESLKLTFES